MSTAIDLCIKKVKEEDIFTEMFLVKEQLVNTKGFKNLIFNQINYYDGETFKDKLFNWYNFGQLIPIRFFYFKNLGLLAYDFHEPVNNFESIYLQDNSDVFEDSFNSSPMIKAEYLYTDLSCSEFMEYLFDKFNVYKLVSSELDLLNIDIVKIDTNIVSNDSWLAYKGNILNDSESFLNDLKNGFKRDLN